MHINENFIPVFDLENEKNDQYWSLFIPNDKFRKILSTAIESLSPDSKKRPVWLQGTYGTGKTHATSVIKHLLCDKTLLDYDLEDNQLTSKLNNFRENNNVLPVVLKGTSDIGDSRRFTLTIQTAVKKVLKQENMVVAVPSEFEKMISILEEYPLKEEDIIGTKLEAFASDEIIFRLKNEETDILVEVEDILMNKGLATIQGNIVDWLIDIRNKLNEEYDIDYLMIFWDEFTGALNMLNVDDILLQIQNIAESKDKGISLFIVSHRTRSTQVNINQEIIDKVMDRFERINYSMEPVATYQLMERSIKKDFEWESVKNRFVGKISPLIKKITENEGPKIKKALENLYPIHPYTAYLATFIAQEIGSTERSIFKFLHDDIEYGFRNFIDTFEIDEKYFLTADYLWEFFYDDFEQSDDEKISSSVKKYKLHNESLRKKPEEYIVIFKVILLLNVLYKIAEVDKGSLAIPSQKNIKNVFIGSIYEDKVEDVLDYIDENSIINKTPDGLFELTTNALPIEQVNAEINKLRKNTKISDLLDIIRLNDIRRDITKKVIREIEIEICGVYTSESRFKMDLGKDNFKNAGYLHMYLFLCITPEEFISINKIIKSVQNTDLSKDKIIIVSEAIFGEENFNKYLEYQARSKVAELHNYAEDVELNKKHANKYINEWVKDIKRKTVSWYLNENDGRLPLSNFINTINTDLSKSIFVYGLENISETLNNKNLWPKVQSKSQAEKYITSNNLEELKDSLKSVDRQSLSILKDNNGNYIVNDNLEMKNSVPDNHPIKIVQDFIDETFDNAQNLGKFNLGAELKPLIDAPYGFYPNKIHVAAISFCLRKYVNKLYDDKGNSIDKTKMKNKIMAIFEFWTKNKGGQDLYIRFGSENEKKLSELINKIFNLDLDSDEQSIDTVRWKLREWIKKNSMPLWLLKYSYISEKNQSLLNAIDALSDFLKPTDSTLPDYIIQDCYENINPVESDLKWCAKESSYELFETFINNLDDEYDFTSEDIESIRKYLDKNMPEEVYDWDESKVESEIFKWIIEQSPESNLKDPNLNVFVDGTKIFVSVDNNATGGILVNVNGEGYFAQIENGVAEIEISNLEAGKSYSAYISYNGDDKFTNAKANVQIEGPKLPLKDPNLSVSVDGTKIFVSVDNDATGNILVNVNGIGYFAQIENGVAEIEISNLEAGKSYSASISYDGDENFKDAKANVQIEVPKLSLKDPNLSVSVDGTKIFASVENDVTGGILVNVNGISYFAQIENGVAEIEISNLEAGKSYSASVLYEGNDNFTNAITEVNIVVPPKEKPTEESISKILNADANILKEVLIKLLENNEEITSEIIIDYLEDK